MEVRLSLRATRSLCCIHTLATKWVNELMNCFHNLGVSRVSRVSLATLCLRCHLVTMHPRVTWLCCWHLRRVACAWVLPGSAGQCAGGLVLRSACCWRVSLEIWLSKASTRILRILRPFSMGLQNGFLPLGRSHTMLSRLLAIFLRLRARLSRSV